MKQLSKYFVVVCCLFFAHITFANAQEDEIVKVSKSELKKLKKAVERYPDSLSFHQAYIKAIGLESPELVKQYATWMKKYPTSAIVPYALGKAYENDERPEAKPYLLKAVKADPKFTEAWGALWIDTERWGDFEQAREYLRKATESDLSNDTYALHYALSFKQVDHDRYVKEVLDLVKRFPNSNRGAQALYWLGFESKDVKDKKKYWKMAHDLYPPAKFSWSASAMPHYYDLLLFDNASAAVQFAQEMKVEMAQDERQSKEWTNLATQAQYILEAKKLISEGKGSEAVSILNKVSLQPTSRFTFNNELPFLITKAEGVTGDTKATYDRLLETFVKAPNLKLKQTILDYGTELGKNGTQVEADIWAILNNKAEIATPFSLKNYFTGQYTALSDYKGKAVLLTYWFPGCGPCRGEFPHLQAVVDKFSKNDLAYVGINIVANQNDYVVPFLKSSGYTFTPLEDVKGREKGNLNNGQAAPVNFLIDQQGRIIFSGFMINGNNEDELELMIKTIVENKKS